MALPKFHVTPLARPISFYKLAMTDDSIFLDMDQPYQRGDVWGLKRRQSLIKSLLSGIPVPAIILNDRAQAHFSEEGYVRERNWAYAVVDGKQRITTIQMFISDKFGVPADWFVEEDVDTVATDGLVYWSGLTRTGQLGIEMTPLPTNESRFATLAQEKELFDLINFGGLAQGEADTDI